MNQDKGFIVGLIAVSALSAGLGSVGTSLYYRAQKSSAPAVSEQTALAEAPEKEPDKKVEKIEAANSGLNSIQMMRMDPESFINKTAKLYVYLQPSDYYNYGYSDSRDSHFAFKACDGEGHQNCANFFIVKTKGRELLQSVLKGSVEKYVGPFTLVVSNLKFRYDPQSSEMFEILDYRKDVDLNLSVGGYTVPDFLSQMGIAFTRVETSWEAHRQSENGELLWVPKVRLYVKNNGERPLRSLHLEGKFTLEKSNESFGTGSNSLSYNEILDPGQTRFLDVSSSIGYRGFAPFPLPEIKSELVLNKSEIGTLNFTGEQLLVSSGHLETLKPAGEKPKEVASNNSADRGPGSVKTVNPPNNPRDTK